ncbi:hypothetical protein CYMTET_50647 [Cymbomonas tetramitiformis]|uniref:Reverse transcriptase Ty1/copia-type domain-containing protein n=1 Tax=Cymbomonas tetramitiformis TaxID=36881 RepID=A0AAE0BPN3_9CHLO|nr:hypothetical protein CYMTET_50647 [Cymbomonas tetramitiformis]
MDEQQMQARSPGVSKKLLTRAWPGRFVGIDLKASSYLICILDLYMDVVVTAGRPTFLRKYTEIGQVTSSFPDHVAPADLPAPTCLADRPQPWRDAVAGSLTASTRTTLLWCRVKAQDEAVKSPAMCPAIIVSTDLPRTQSYGAVFQPTVFAGSPLPRENFPMNLVARLMVFPGSHAARHASAFQTHLSGISGWLGETDRLWTPHETSFMVADLPTCRLLFILAIIFSSLGLRVFHYDVSQAFMHAKLDVPMHIKFPSGFAHQGRHRFAKLLYALYGLRAAGWGFTVCGAGFGRYLSPVHVDTKINLAVLFTKPLVAMRDRIFLIRTMVESYIDVFRLHPGGVGTA